MLQGLMNEDAHESNDKDMDDVEDDEGDLIGIASEDDPPAGDEAEKIQADLQPHRGHGLLEFLFSSFRPDEEDIERGEGVENGNPWIGEEEES